MATITILGAQHVTTQPPDFAAAEEVVLHLDRYRVAGGDAISLNTIRVLSAAIGFVLPGLAAAAGANWYGGGCDVLKFGGKVYGYLRERGATPEEVAAAGMEAVQMCAEKMFPRKSEVEQRAGFSGPAVVAPTA